MQQLTKISALDLNELTKKISDESPTGINVRLDEKSSNAYYKLRDLRQQLRRVEREQNTIVDKDWREVIELCCQLLMISKDLEITVWLLEGLLREYGLVGFYDGLQLINYYLVNYSFELQPQPEEGGDEKDIVVSLVNNFSEPNSSLLVPLNLITLLHGSELSVWTYKQARKEDEETLESILQETSNTNSEEIPESQDLLKAILEQLTNIENEINDIFYEQSPISFSLIETIIQEMLSIVAQLQKRTSIDIETKPCQSNTEEDKLPQATSQKSIDIIDYESFKLQLQMLTNFMQNAQPHSLITMQLVRILRWSEMPMEEVIEEMFLDKNIALHVAHNFGIPLDKIDYQNYEEDEN